MRLILGLVLVLGVAVGASAQQPVTLAFATLDTESAWYVYGATMAELLRKALPAGSNVDVKPFAGGVGNAKLVAKNETPIALSFTVTNRWAFEGKEAYDTRLESLRWVGFPTVVITNKDLPEPVAYTITRAIVENKDALVRGHAGLAGFEPQIAWQPDKVGIPLYPGAERVYREKGWMK